MLLLKDSRRMSRGGTFKDTNKESISNLEQACRWEINAWKMIICKNQQEQQMKTEIWGDASVQILVNLDNRDVRLTAFKDVSKFPFNNHSISLWAHLTLPPGLVSYKYQV